MAIFIRKLQESKEDNRHIYSGITPIPENEWKHVNAVLIDEEISKPYPRMKEMIRQGKWKTGVRKIVCQCKD